MKAIKMKVTLKKGEVTIHLTKTVYYISKESYLFNHMFHKHKMFKGKVKLFETDQMLVSALVC